jgi:hypothetical protein
MAERPSEYQLDRVRELVMKQDDESLTAVLAWLEGQVDELEATLQEIGQIVTDPYKAPEIVRPLVCERLNELVADGRLTPRLLQ